MTISRTAIPMFPYYIMLIVLLLATFVSSMQQSDKLVTRTLVKRGGGRYCGAALDDVLRLVCKSSYNSIFESKRSSSPQAVEKVARIESENPRFPYTSKRAALSLLPTDRAARRRRQIVNECCIMKSCTIQELSGYCSQR